MVIQPGIVYSPKNSAHWSKRVTASHDLNNLNTDLQTNYS